MHGCDQLVTDNLDLARAAASYFMRFGALRHLVGGFDDLHQAACVCLIEAARVYDPSKGKCFRQFAALRIRQRLIDCGRQRLGLIHLPRNAIRRAQEARADGTGGDLTTVFLCKEQVADRGQLDAALADVERREEVAELLRRLPAHQRRVLELRYGLGGQRPHGWDEVARAEGLSEAGVLARWRSALDELRQMYARWEKTNA